MAGRLIPARQTDGIRHHLMIRVVYLRPRGTEKLPLQTKNPALACSIDKVSPAPQASIMIW